MLWALTINALPEATAGLGPNKTINVAARGVKRQAVRIGHAPLGFSRQTSIVNGMHVRDNPMSPAASIRSMSGQANGVGTTTMVGSH